MATHAPDFGRASALPLSAVLGALPSYPRPVIERLVARLIDHLDAFDPDPDFEQDDWGGGAVDDEDGVHALGGDAAREVELGQSPRGQEARQRALAAGARVDRAERPLKAFTLALVVGAVVSIATPAVMGALIRLIALTRSSTTACSMERSPR